MLAKDYCARDYQVRTTQAHKISVIYLILPGLDQL